jgi:hypothetical protein
MPIVTPSELRAVLGVSESLFSDAYLEEIIDSAELTILPMLTANNNAIASYKILDGTITFNTIKRNNFVEGQDIIVTGLGAVDATYTVDDKSYLPFSFCADTNLPDTATTIPVIPSGVAVLDGSSAAELYANAAPVHSAILVVSVEIFQSVTASGNMTSSIDQNPSPFVLGRSLQNRVIGLLSTYIDVETMAQ